jgi:hypothetical protein
MRSWQRRMAAADRRFTHAASLDQPAPDTNPSDVSGTVDTAAVTLSTVAPATASPSAATQLAAMLRAELVTGEVPPVVLAGTG